MRDVDWRWEKHPMPQGQEGGLVKAGLYQCLPEGQRCDLYSELTAQRIPRRLCP